MLLTISDSPSRYFNQHLPYGVTHMNITEVVTYTIPHSRRREELSVCNVLYAILVILIHLLAEPIEQLSKDHILYFLAVGFWRLSSFVVQGYFFLSGTKLFLGGPPVRQESSVKIRDLAEKTAISNKFHHILKTWCSFYWGRIRRVVLPYLCIFTVFILYFSTIGTFNITPGNLLYNFVTGKLCGHFYYVILICQFYLLMPLWQRVIRRTPPMFLLPVAMLMTIMCKIYMPSLVELITGKAFEDNGLLFTSYLFYFLAGAAIGPVYDRFRVFLQEHHSSLLCGFLCIGLTNWVLFWLMSRGYFYLPWLELFHMLYCLYAIPATLSLACHFREAKLFHTTIFVNLDKWSYHIYLLHPLAIFITSSFLSRFNITRQIIRFPFIAICTYGSMIFFSFIAGKWKKHKSKQT